MRAELSGPPGEQVLRLLQGERLVASRQVGRPVEGCELRLVQADGLPGLEILLSWRFGEAPDRIAGLMVFRVPESAPVVATPAP